MSHALLIALVVVAALACPLHMWWMNRRGKRPLCCPPPRKDDVPVDLETLRARRRDIDAELAQLTAGPPVEASAAQRRQR